MKKCGGSLVIQELSSLNGKPLIRYLCVRCHCRPGYYATQPMYRCPVLRGKLWKPRPSVGNDWNW